MTNAATTNVFTINTTFRSFTKNLTLASSFKSPHEKPFAACANHLLLFHRQLPACAKTLWPVAVGGAVEVAGNRDVLHYPFRAGYLYQQGVGVWRRGSANIQPNAVQRRADRRR